MHLKKRVNVTSTLAMQFVLCRRQQNHASAKSVEDLNELSSSPVSSSVRSIRLWSCIRKSLQRLSALYRPSLFVFRLLFSITLFAACHRNAQAQEVTTKTPSTQTQTQTQPTDTDKLPEDPSISRFPVAQPEPSTDGTEVSIESVKQTRDGDLYTLEGDVVIIYGPYTVEADRVEYDGATGDVTGEGHLRIRGGRNHERIAASHGTMNLKSGSGRFYDVTGSIGVKTTTKGTVYTIGNPFIFTGRMVVRDGPEHYEIYDGTVTSCQLPNPDWRFSSAKFLVHDGSARAYNSVFRLLNIPIFYLPYIAHPTDTDSRQSGLLIPVIGQSSSKGFIFGEQIFFVINRSTDLTVGVEYFSLRGWSQSAAFRWKGGGLSHITAHYSGLQDRGYTPKGGVYTNQGGEDAVISARKDFDEHTRIAADIEYLSSYVYREAFTDNFNQAIASDIVSTAYGVHDTNGYVMALHADRYQGLKDVQSGTQVRILHVPSLDFDVIERSLGISKLVWSMEDSVAGLKRVQPDFATRGVSERIDLHPKLSLPLSLGEWKFRPTIGLRDTYYTHSRQPIPVPDAVPVELNTGVNRALFEAEGEVRAPVIERVFDTPGLERFLGRRIKHTIETEAHYRYVTGVDNFNSILRFDPVDVVSNTNEIEYSVTQNLFLQPTKLHTCTEGETPAEEGGLCGGTRESLRWRLSQKHFFDPYFGGVIVPNRRNILETTLDFSGVAFLTEPRNTSPIQSELRLSATEKLDVEWDMNYDTHAGKFTASNVFLNYHDAKYFAGIGEARLNAPGRSLTGTTSSEISDFNQLRILLGYGSPTKPGLSIAANTGLDLKLATVQYGTLQAAYNWNCCGFSIEYRKFELGSVRNENVYRFNFTLANIGAAGNLRHAERLF